MLSAIHAGHPTQHGAHDIMHAAWKTKGKLNWNMGAARHGPICMCVLCCRGSILVMLSRGCRFLTCVHYISLDKMGRFVCARYELLQGQNFFNKLIYAWISLSSFSSTLVSSRLNANACFPRKPNSYESCKLGCPHLAI